MKLSLINEIDHKSLKLAATASSEEQQYILDIINTVAENPESHWDPNRIFIADVIASSGGTREWVVKLLTQMRERGLINFSQVDLVESGTPEQREKMVRGRILYMGAEYNLIRLPNR